MEPIRVVIADESRLFREGLRCLVGMESDILVVGEASDGVETLEKVRQLLPQILLIDVGMPRMDGIQVIRSLGRQNQEVAVIVLTALEEGKNLCSLGSTHLRGCILKSSGIMNLLSAVRMVARGEFFIDKAIENRDILQTDDLVRHISFDGIKELTPKEMEVLYWLSQGMRNNEIAAQMILSEKTVKNHVSHILKKLDLKDRTQAAVTAWRTGLVHEYSDVFHKGPRAGLSRFLQRKTF